VSRHLLSALLVGVLLIPAHPAPAFAQSVVLDGVSVQVQAGTSQVVTVNRTRSWHARVTWWSRDASGWHQVLRTSDGRIGHGGLVRGDDRKQGTGTTPLGTYGLIGSFGIHRKQSTWDLPYRRIRRGDYWVQDNGSAFYNRYRHRSQGGFRWWLRSGPNASERLTDYRQQYEWAVNTSFNRSQVRHRGSGIFLHVNGRGATAGCVSVPRWFMRSAMVRIDPDRTPVIAIGR